MRAITGMTAGVLGALGGVWMAAVPMLASAQGQAVTCGSVSGRYARCPVPWPDARLVHQDSDTRCERGRNWGFDPGAIWVDRGCRGQFVAAGGGGWGDRDRGGGWRDDDRYRGRDDRVVQCGSVDGRYRECPADVGPGDRVRLANNDSDTRCVEGNNWGVRRGAIWVDRGCRGRWVVSNRRW